ncbi:LIM/homeobox protein Lhx9-like [Ctenocephalides felis]|uniref:LIM/homeobox protein Lhx9-like n=1 Tax=Ctenocephalides felis TaxID=7515 RepID=UPI000E6E29A8|nr:LIM/homeobox protein Lhx9-like [Ctenocephalides felis]
MNSSTSPHQHSPFPSYGEIHQQQMSPGSNSQQMLPSGGNGNGQQQQMVGNQQMGGGAGANQQQMMTGAGGAGSNQQHLQQMFQFQQHGQQLAAQQQQQQQQQMTQGYVNGTPTQVSAMGKLCAGCGYRIEERFLLLALDRYWHHACLKCTYCQATLADLGASCFSKRGMILCKGDYHRMFAGSNGASSGGGPMGANNGPCSACGQAIPASELVMRAPGGAGANGAAGGAVFHLACFVCSKCGGHLRQGDRYYMLGGNLVCEQDWQKLLKSSSATSASVRKGKVGRPRRSRD